MANDQANSNNEIRNDAGNEEVAGGEESPDGEGMTDEEEQPEENGEDEEGAEEAGEDESQEVTVGGSGISLMSPEGVLILLYAIFIDVVAGIINLILVPVFGIGVALSWIIDIFATLTIGWWAWTRARVLVNSKTTLRIQKGMPHETLRKMQHEALQKMVKKLLGKVLVRFGIAIAIEIVPVAGDIIPSWTIFVLSLLS